MHIHTETAPVCLQTTNIFSDLSAYACGVIYTFPALSVAVQVTLVYVKAPKTVGAVIKNVEPEGGEQTTDEMPEASVARGVKLTGELVALFDVLARTIRMVPDQVVTAPGHVMLGMAESVIVMVNEHEAVRLALSLAVQVTVVAPRL